MTKLMCIVALVLSCSAWAGQEREGGDDLGLVFQQSFMTAYTYFKVNMPDVAAKLQTLPTLALISKVIIVDDPLYVTVGGVKQESAAVNDPSTNTIWVNRARWQKIQDIHVAEGLALHEFACLGHFEETGLYTYSAQYVEQFGYQNGDMGNTEGGQPVKRLTVYEARGVSWYTLTGGGVAIFGGTAGRACTATDSVSTCDSCETTIECGNSAGDPQGPLCACSRSRIYDGLIASLWVSGGDGHTLRVQATNASSGQTSATLPTINASAWSVSFRWGDACSHMPTQGSCEGMNQNGSVVVFDDTNEDGILDNGERSFTVSINVQSPQVTGVGTTSAVSDFSIYGEPNMAGIGAFGVWPGDQRAYINSVNVTIGFPTLMYGGSATAVRFFVSSHSMLEATPLGRDIEYDIPLMSDQQLAQDYVPGLTNGKLYFVRLALLDQSNNVVQFFPPMDTLPKSCTTAPDATCPYAVTPSQVAGLIQR